jgi:hypothetical protein
MLERLAFSNQLSTNTPVSTLRAVGLGKMVAQALACEELLAES